VARVRVSIDHIPKICGPPEYHLRSIKRLKKKKRSKVALKGCGPPGHVLRVQREFKLQWREAGPPNHHDDTVDSDQ